MARVSSAWNEPECVIMVYKVLKNECECFTVLAVILNFFIYFSIFRIVCQYPGFSVEWNKVECVAHIIYLGVQEFKQPLNLDTYQEDEAVDEIISRLIRIILCNFGYLRIFL